METPIYNFLKKYSDSNTLRLHMPGHKGKHFANLNFEHDITEIHNADSLFESDGIISESEKNTAKLAGAYKTCYSTGGSTLCIQTMLSLMKQDNRNVIAVRNVHKSFLSSCVLLGIEPEWIYPKYSAGYLSGEIPIDILENKLKKTKRPCVYITSPDYLGKMANINLIAKLCHKYNGVLLVDNAHGAHNIGSPNHPISQGADICCDSAHKMLPVLTGGAYLHIANMKYTEFAKSQMSLFGSTSPSYLIMASLDMCNNYIETYLAKDMKLSLSAIKKLQKKIAAKYEIYNGDPYHLTLLCNGISLSRQLRIHGIECEYADNFCIVLLLSPINTTDEIEKIGNILMQLDPEKTDNIKYEFPVMERILGIRDAYFSESEKIRVENSLGRICSAVTVPCPPAVPIAVSGEKINEKCIDIYQRYGISTINVVK